MSHHCPGYQRVLFNRRLTHCGFCGAEIPEGLRFTPDGIAALEQELAELEERHRQRELVVDKEAEEQEAKRHAEEIKRLISPI